jgi:hydroxymethylglutaryl-CoA synthase
MQNVGIDAIGFYSPHYYLDLKTLAKARGIDVDKFYIGLGQRKMALPSPGEDIVTLAANAAISAIKDVDVNDIEMVLLATESGVDYSKAGSIYVHKLLGLPARCRALELKQACYSATAGLQMSLAMLKQNPKKKILLIASDIARYSLNTPAESSQGAGAVAMLLSVNPRILTIEPESGFYTKDQMDFWRPLYCDAALVDGKFSCDLYLRVLDETWKQYAEISGRSFLDHDRFCYHIPIPRLVEKAHKRLAKLNNYPDLSDEKMASQVGNSLILSREIGNCYTASLYLGILSLLENTDEDLSKKMIGLYSYGSGCSGEFFAAKVVPEYKKMLNRDVNFSLIENREELSYDKYLDFYNFKLPEDGSNYEIPTYNTGQFRLAGINQHKRSYNRL